MATQYEKPGKKLELNQDVTFYDNDEYNNGIVHGKVTEIGYESFMVQWEDLDDPTEYEFAKVVIQGEQIFENGERDTNTNPDQH